MSAQEQGGYFKHSDHLISKFYRPFYERQGYWSDLFDGFGFEEQS